MRILVISCLGLMTLGTPAMAADESMQGASSPPRTYYDYRFPVDDDVTYDGDYRGRWVGTWYGNDGRTYSGEYRGRYYAPAPQAGVDYGAPPADAPLIHEHPRQWAAPSMPPPMVYRDYGYGYPAGGYAAGDYYYPAPMVTTIIIPPAAAPREWIEEKITYVPVRTRTWKPRAHRSAKAH